MQTSLDSEISAEVGAEAKEAWCALYTRHQHEKAVAEMLSAKGFQVFLPLYRSMRRWHDRKKMLALPLFPCYVFVRGGVRRRLQIVTTPGVHMIVCVGDQVATIPEHEIESLRKTIDGDYCVEPHPFLKCGERVRVKHGALEGVEGVLVRKKNLCRLILSVNMLAQSVSVEIDASEVEPVLVPRNPTRVSFSPSGRAGKYRNISLSINGRTTVPVG
jgi:transcription antitermination factor NusG